MGRGELEQVAETSQRPPVPPLWTPLGFLLFGLTSLLLALGTVAWWPALLLTGPLAPPVVAVVHLLTLGFVTSTILGSLYLVSGFAFRARMQEGPADLGALVLYAIGTAWVVRGFFAGRPGDEEPGTPQGRETTDIVLVSVRRHFTVIVERRHDRRHGRWEAVHAS